MYKEKIDWEFVGDAVEKIFSGKSERLDYETKLVVVKVYRAGTIIRIDIKEN